MEKILVWCGSVLIAVATAVVFLFTTFQTSAAADRAVNYIDSRLDKIEQKIDQLIQQVK